MKNNVPCEWCVQRVSFMLMLCEIIIIVWVRFMAPFCTGWEKLSCLDSCCFWFLNHWSGHLSNISHDSFYRMRVLPTVVANSSTLRIMNHRLTECWKPKVCFMLILVCHYHLNCFYRVWSHINSKLSKHLLLFANTRYEAMKNYYVYVAVILLVAQDFFVP